MNLDSIRTRMVVSVAAMFGITAIASGLFMVDRLERAMIGNAEESATALVSDYVSGLRSGSVIPDEEPQFTTRLIFLGDDGKEISSDEFGFIVISSAPIVRDANGVLLSEFDKDPVGPVGTDFEDTQVFDESGNPVSGTELLISEGITFDLTPIDVGELVIDESEEFLTVSLPVGLNGRALTIGAEQSLVETRHSVATLKSLLVLGVPVLTLFVAGIAWWVVSGALKPVAAMAARVDAISNESLDQRVPELTSTDELAHLARTMNAMLTRLQDSRDSQRRFISDASHELRSPITATKATIEVARAHPESTDWSATAEVLEEENHRLAGLVDDLLLLASLDESPTDVTTAQLDLDELCLAEAERPHPVPVRVQVDAPARVVANLGRLSRAIRNLVDNGARHAASEVLIRVDSQDGYGLIEVSDDGSGIDPELQERVFDRFTRHNESRNRSDGAGAGLGLAITRQIVESAGGTITATNQAGAVFTILLPLEVQP